jgi:thiaminase
VSEFSVYAKKVAKENNNKEISKILDDMSGMIHEESKLKSEFYEELKKD